MPSRSTARTWSVAPKTSWRLRPRSLARYMAMSASRSRSVVTLSACEVTATPTLTVATTSSLPIR